MNPYAAPCAILCASLLSFCASAAPPTLHFEKSIGDARGKSIDNCFAAAGEDGWDYLLMANGRIATFSPDGRYAGSLETEQKGASSYISIHKRLILAGDFKSDYAWLMQPQRKGAAPGSFESPKMAVEDNAGSIYVADFGNSRIQIFAKGKRNAPESILPLKGKPLTIAEQSGVLAIALDDGTISLWRKSGGVFSQFASMKAEQAVSLAFANGGKCLLAAFRDSLKKYSIAGTQIMEQATLSTPYMAQWPDVFLRDTSFINSPDGRIYYIADSSGKLLSLDPSSDAIRELGSLPPRTHSFAIAPDGALFSVGMDGSDGKAFIHRLQLANGKLEDLGMFNPEPLFKEPVVQVSALLPDSDGGVYVRVVEEGSKKGWPALCFKKAYQSAKPKDFLDFGSLYAVRTRFSPWDCSYSLKFDGERNIIIAARALVGVYKVSRDGKILGRQASSRKAELTRSSSAIPATPRPTAKAGFGSQTPSSTKSSACLRRGSSSMNMGRAQTSTTSRALGSTSPAPLPWRRLAASSSSMSETPGTSAS